MSYFLLNQFDWRGSPLLKDKGAEALVDSVDRFCISSVQTTSTEDRRFRVGQSSSPQ
ncbi:hypothetical protein X736_31920 [Mesorhizobium sp. L2C089B000]|nr:hypothetical protein X736_31920 [Mesorhizobium sp. L2C089B000]